MSAAHHTPEYIEVRLATAEAWDRTAVRARIELRIALDNMWDDNEPTWAHWLLVKPLLERVDQHAEFLALSIHEREVRDGLRALGAGLRAIGGALEPQPSAVELIRARIARREKGNE